MLYKYALAASLLATPAYAAVETVTSGPASIGITDDNGHVSFQGNGQISVAKFDPSLGTLTGVSITLVDPHFDTLISTQAHSNGISVAHFSYSVSVAGLTFTGGASGSCFTPACSISQSDSEAAEGQTTENIAALAGYIGPGSMFYDLTTAGWSFSSQCGSCNVDEWAEFVTGLQVSYTYTPFTAPVPEPGTLAIMGIGCLGLGTVFAAQKRGRA